MPGRGDRPALDPGTATVDFVLWRLGGLFQFALVVNWCRPGSPWATAAAPS